MQTPTPNRVLEIDQANIGVAGRELVNRLSLSLHAGDWLALLGRNGAGKTQTLRALCGLEALQSGQLRWLGRDAEAHDAAARARAVTLVSQHQHDAFDNDVQRHVLLGRYPHHGAWRSPSVDDHRAVRDALAALDLISLAQQEVTRLSGGERQRVAIAQALVQNTPLLLVDEPLSHQDPAGSARILSCLDGYRGRGGTIVSAMHDINLARRFASHALILDSDGGWQMGKSADLISPSTVTALYGVPMRSVEVDGIPWFIPAPET